MRLEKTEDGFAIDAADLGALLELDPAEVQRMMRSGIITSRIERGEGEDAGRYRLSFYSPDRRIRLIVDDDGAVLQRNRVLRSRPGNKVERAGPED